MNYAYKYEWSEFSSVGNMNACVHQELNHLIHGGREGLASVGDWATVGIYSNCFFVIFVRS